MVLMGAEFIAMILIIIYVCGQLLYCFFVTMTLDIKFTELKETTISEMAFAFFLPTFLFADLVVVVLLGSKVIAPEGNTSFAISPDIGNAYNIGRLIYTEFLLPFQTARVILFVAMIASIALTN